MNNKRNVIVMFLFVMLSFAIVSEVSAVSDAEADGTGLDFPVQSVNMNNHDVASERDNDQFVQDYDIDYRDEFESHNEQNSFNRSPESGDKNIENGNFYEHKMDNDYLPLNQSLKNESIPMLQDNKFNSSMDLRNNNFTAVPNGEAMNDIIPKLDGLKNITPDIKKDEKNLSGVNMRNPKPYVDVVSDQQGPDKNKSAVLPEDIKNMTNLDKTPKIVKKVKNSKAKANKKIKNAKAKSIKKSKTNKPKTIKKVKNNKFKSIKKVKNSNPKTIKNSKNLKNNTKKERAKL